MTTRRRRLLASIPLTAAFGLGSLIGSSAVLATGTCPGRATEYVLAPETQTVDPLQRYDVNRDGVICVSVKPRKTVYGDNRP